MPTAVHGVSGVQRPRRPGRKTGHCEGHPARTRVVGSLASLALVTLPALARAAEPLPGARAARSGVVPVAATDYTPSGASLAEPAAVTVCTAGGCSGTLRTRDLGRLYGWPATAVAARGRAAVIGVGAPRAAAAALAHVDAVEGLPAVALRLHCPQGCPVPATGGAALDWQIATETVHEAAPGLAAEDLYAARDASAAAVTAAVRAWVDDPHGAPLAVLPPHTCEALPRPDGADPGGAVAAQRALERVLARAAARYRTLVVPTGDVGAGCASSGPGLLAQSYPAVSPHVLAVGGTVLRTAPGTGARVSETASPTSGGGVSISVPAPDWQREQTQLVLPCPAALAAAPAVQCRGVPDVAALSGLAVAGRPVSGVLSCSPTACGTAAGTVVAAGLWTGMLTRLTVALPGQLGFQTPLLYQLGDMTDRLALDFVDVVAGSNGVAAATTYWDYMSGFGAPRLDRLLAEVRS